MFCRSAQVSSHWWKLFSIFNICYITLIMLNLVTLSPLKMISNYLCMHWKSLPWHNIIMISMGHCIKYQVRRIRGFPGAQTVKNPPAMQETLARSLGREDPLQRKWQLTPVFLPRESHGQRSLVGYGPWSHNTTEKLTLSTLRRIREKRLHFWSLLS